MAQEMKNRALTDPVLIAPQHEDSVVGRDVTLRWEPVVGARGYVVQVSRDAEFADLVLEEAAGTDTSLRLENVLPEDRTTYYWRVFAQADGVESPGEHIESFIALSPSEMQAAPQTQPRLDEPLGPIEGLVKSAGVEVAAEVTGSESSQEAAEHMGFEPEGVEAAQILGLVLGVLAALAILVVVIFNWTNIVRNQTYAQAAGASGYPELTETERAAEQELTQYEVLDEGVYRVPIDRVITLMSNEAQQGGDSARAEELPLLPDR